MAWHRAWWVHHPVPKGRGADQALLGFVNGKVVICAGLVGVCLQLGLQGQQLALQVQFKIGHRLAVCLIKAFKAANLWKQAFIGFQQDFSFVPKNFAAPCGGRTHTPYSTSIRCDANYLIQIQNFRIQKSRISSSWQGHTPKTEIEVTKRRGVVVAVRRAQVEGVEVERASAQHLIGSAGWAGRVG